MADESPDDGLLATAAHVSRVARELGVANALIGAAALAAHGYVRATEDIDLATAADPFTDLRRLADRLRSDGFEVVLREPDDEDPLGGVMDVRRTGDERLVQVVNFFNPLRARSNPGRAAIEMAIAASPVPYARLEELIALKLYAGGRQARNDVLELLDRHPEADLSSIRAVCARYELATDFDALLATR